MPALRGLAGLTLAFIAGAATATATLLILRRKREDGEDEKGDDEFCSLFYPTKIEPDGRGVPHVHTCDQETKDRMCTVHKDYRFLPKDLYASLAELCVITCVDVILQRRCDKKLLLFYRRDAPAASIWWWPGGRMFRGETFSDTARRKIKDETGGVVEATPKGVVGVWNTFFPDSAWDKGRQGDRAGTQTMNVVLVCETDWDPSTARAAAPAGQVKDWAVEAQRWVTVQEALKAGAFDKYVSRNVSRALRLGLVRE